MLAKDSERRAELGGAGTAEVRGRKGVQSATMNAVTVRMVECMY